MGTVVDGLEVYLNTCTRFQRLSDGVGYATASDADRNRLMKVADNQLASIGLPTGPANTSATVLVTVLIPVTGALSTTFVPDSVTF